jgi:hypothetical protein
MASRISPATGLRRSSHGAGNPGIWSHLSQVEELDNTQKHRLRLTGVTALQMRNFVLMDNGMAKLIPEAFFRILPGAMIIANDVKPDSRSRAVLPPTLSFMSPGRRRDGRLRTSCAISTG